MLMNVSCTNIRSDFRYESTSSTITYAGNNLLLLARGGGYSDGIPALNQKCLMMCTQCKQSRRRMRFTQIYGYDYNYDICDPEEVSDEYYIRCK